VTLRGKISIGLGRPRQRQQVVEHLHCSERLCCKPRVEADVRRSLVNWGPGEQAAEPRRALQGLPFRCGDAGILATSSHTETPANPDSFKSVRSSSSLPIAPRRRSVKIIPGSIEPLREPIMRPSIGVIPIVESIMNRPRPATIEQPLPRWTDTTRRAGSSLPQSRALRSSASRWLIREIRNDECRSVRARHVVADRW
jgi:hypothetical protein